MTRPSEQATASGDARAPAAGPPSITDVVFEGHHGGHDLRLAICALAVLIVYGGLFVLSQALGTPLSDWSAEMAARIHDAVSRERAVTLAPPPPPPPPAAPAAPEPVAVRAPRPVHVRAPAHAAPPSPPAQAGKLTAVTNAPVDFTGSAFVVGGAATFPGGVTSAQGKGKVPGTSAAAPPGPATGGGGAGHRPSRARAVSLDQAAWSCPWPAEADAEQVNEETVVLRARVQPDGRAESVEVLADPGFGFGAAARACALATRFEPARDAEGRPVAALSAPIRVHFYR